jgi:hypothetical protein
MSHKLACLATILVATACTTDPTEPRTTRAPATPSLALIPIFGYQPSVLPLEYGAAMNAAGDVVGTLGGKGVHYTYATGAITALALPPTVTEVTPVDVVNDGRILARGNGPQGPKALYYPSPTGSPIDIAAPRWAEPSAMNEQGVAVGRFGAGERAWSAFRWSASSGLADITPPGVDMAWPTDISETGYIVGTIQTGNLATGYRWDALGGPGVALPSTFSVYQALKGGSVLVRDPAIGSAIWSPTALTGAGPDPVRLLVVKISPVGRFVGNFTDPLTRAQRAWTSIGTGAAITLPLPPGFSSSTATDVNACGAVLGHGVLTSTGERRAIVWSDSFTCDLAPPTPKL